MADISAGGIWFGSQPNIYFDVSYTVTRNLTAVSVYFDIGISGVGGASKYGYNLTAQPATAYEAFAVTVLKNNTPLQWSAYTVQTGWCNFTVSDLSQTSVAMQIVFRSNSGRTTIFPFTVTLPNLAPSTVASAVDFIVGNDLPITISRSSSTFTAQARVSVAGNDLGAVWAIDGTETVLPLAAYAEQIYGWVTDSNAATAVVSLTTYNGSTVIGSTAKTGTAHLTAAECLPLFDAFTLSHDKEGLTGAAGVIVPGHTNAIAMIETPATAQKGATMVRYDAACGDVTGSVAYASTPVSVQLAGISGNVVSVSAVDSRGNATKVSQGLTVLDYVPPAIGTLTLTRDNQVDETAVMTYSGTIWDKTFGARKNAFVSAAWRYRQAGAETWTSGTTAIMPTVKADGTFSFSGAFAPSSGGWASDKSYEVEIMLTDCVTSATMTATLNVGVPGIYLKRAGAAYQVGIGKIPDIADGVDIKGLLKIGGFADPPGVRDGLNVPMRPKLLWSGSWSSGSITVGDFSSYKLLLVQTTDGDSAVCWKDGNLLLGGGLYPLSGSGGQMAYSVRASFSANTLTLQNSYALVHGISGQHSGQYTRTVKAIYGLLLNGDVQTEGA